MRIVSDLQTKLKKNLYKQCHPRFILLSTVLSIAMTVGTVKTPHDQNLPSLTFPDSSLQDLCMNVI